MRHTRPAVRAAVVGGAALLLTGCLQAELDMTIEDDGSAEMVITTTLDFGAARDLFGEDGASLEDFGIGSIDELIEQAMADPETTSSSIDTTGLPDDAEIDTETERDGDKVISTTTITEIDYQDLNEWIQASSDDGLELTIDRDGDEWTVEGTADVQGVRDQAAGDMPTDELPGDLGEGFEQLLGQIAISIVATLPGGVAEHEGGEVDGSTVRWTFTPADDSGDFSARWAPGAGGDGGSSLGVVIAILAVVALVAALVTWLVLRQRRRGSPPPAGDGPTAGPTDAASSPPSGETGTVPSPSPAAPGAPLPPPPPPPPAQGPGGSDLPPPTPR